MPKIKIDICDNYSGLDLFLKQHRASSGGTFTHTSISGNRGSFFIPDNDLEDFFGLYYDHVFNKKLPAHLTEGIRDCPITPVKIDLDFRKYKHTDKEIPDKIYDIEDIIKIAQRYMKAMEEWLVSPDPEERYCFILEKPNARYDLDKNGTIKTNEKGEKRIKDGVHIMFPYIITNTHLQLKFRDEVYKKVGDILDKYEYDESYAEIFDRAVIDRNNWQMYGSNKGTSFSTYKVTKIIEVYENDFCEIDNEKYTDETIMRLLSVRNREDASMIQYEKKLILDDMMEKQRVIETKKRKYSSRSKTSKNKTNKDELRLVLGYSENGKTYNGFVDCLSLERARNYETWIEVGWALHNIDNTSRKFSKSKEQYNLTKDKVWCDLLCKWMDWGRQDGSGYEKEPDETYIELWENMRCDGLGIGSLKLWARLDSIDTLEKEITLGVSTNKTKSMYQEIIDRDLETYLLKASNKKGGNSYDVAKVMYQMYKHDFICVSIKDIFWYYYDTNLHKWIEDDKGIHLKMKISTEIWEKFNNLSIKYASLVEEPGDYNEMKRDSLQKTASKLKETSFKSNIMTECAELFYDKTRSFYKNLDSNMNLLGFNNGVYDLSNDEFRMGRPEDNITMSTCIDFIPFDEHSNEIRGIQKFFSEILTIKEVCDYVLRLMSSFLSGSTKSEKFHVWSGSGGNGKSKLIELLEKSLGDYAGKMNISNLTQKRGNAGSANPELARTKGKRFINMQEPDEHCKLNVGLMKEITGGDKIIARALYKEPVEFKPQFKMVLTCNDKPELPPDDEGTWRRVVLVEYASKFRHDPLGSWFNKDKERITNEEHKQNMNLNRKGDYWVPDNMESPQFPIDESLNQKFDDWSEPFMSLLIHTYKKYSNTDLLEPTQVREYTKKYREQNEHFKEFMNDKIVFDKSDERIIRLDEFYSEYKSWYKDSYPNGRTSKTKQEFKIFMDKNFENYKVSGKYSKTGFKGLSFIYKTNTYDELDDE